MQVDGGDQGRHLREHQSDHDGYDVFHETSLEQVPGLARRVLNIFTTKTKAGFVPRPSRAPVLTGSLCGSDVLRLHPFASLRRLVSHLGALFQGLEPLAGYTGMVHEEVLTPVVRGDEAVALLVAEPLHCSLGHNTGAHLSYSWAPLNEKATLNRGVALRLA